MHAKRYRREGLTSPAVAFPLQGRTPCARPYIPNTFRTRGPIPSEPVASRPGECYDYQRVHGLSQPCGLPFEMRGFPLGRSFNMGG